MKHSDVCTIIQAKNAEETILHVLSQVARAQIGNCVVIANGCTDETISLASSFFERFSGVGKITVFSEPLGPDVGKAVGTYSALRLPEVEAQWFVYVDSDWKGGFGPSLERFVNEAKHRQADVLFVGHTETLQHSRFYIREDIRLWERVFSPESALHGIAVSESPVAVHKRVFTLLSPYWLHQPGLFAAHCLQPKPPLHLAVSKEWIPRLSGNPTKSASHQKKMLDTLVGDAVEAIAVLGGHQRQRRWKGREWIGYHQERRVDLLRQYMETIQI